MRDTEKKVVSVRRRQPSSYKWDKEPPKRRPLSGTDGGPQRKRPSAGTENRPQQRPLSGRCPAEGRCGGCELLPMPYQEQLQKKERWVRELLKGICPVYPIRGMEHPYHYRNKVTAAFQYRKGGEIVSGIYQEGTHRVVPVESCLLEDETADRIIGSIRRLLRDFRIKVYDEDTGYGFLRHVMVRRGFATGQIMVVLVASSPVFPSRKHFVDALCALHPEISTILLNLNDRHTSMVLGERNIILFGKGYIEDRLCGLTFRISPQSFYQVNPVQTERLYRKAIGLAGLTGKERVIDAYCGIGTIGLAASALAGEVIGVELNQEAVRDAIRNKKSNGIVNASFYARDAGEFMCELAEQGGTADVVFMDPPRQGSEEAFLTAAARLAPERIVYISCDPETLARDLRLLRGLGYQAKEAWPFDMFCWCEKVETAVLLQRKERKVSG